MMLAVKSLTSLCLSVGKLQLRACSTVNDAPHEYLLGGFVGCQPYRRHSAAGASIGRLSIIVWVAMLWCHFRWLVAAWVVRSKAATVC